VKGTGAGVVRITGDSASGPLLTFHRTFTLQNLSVVAPGARVALSVVGQGTSALDAKLDDVILAGGPSAGGVGLSAVSETAGLGVGSDGNLTVTARRLTVAGGNLAVGLNAGANSAMGGGDIAASFSGSLVYGPTSVVHSVGRTATLSVPAETNRTSGSPGGAIFRDDTTARDFRLRVDAATVIDKAPAVDGTEPSVDLEGDARTLIGNRFVGALKPDFGADEVANLPPSTPTAGSSPASPHAGDLVTVSATGSVDPEAAIGGGIIAYAWSFGDGQTLVTATGSASHTYDTVGSFRVTVQAIDAQGFASGDGTTTVTTVAGSPSGGPAVLAVSDRRPRQRASVRFDASGSKFPSGDPIARFRFDFGDGTVEVSYQGIALHAYANPGRYSASVTFTTAGGFTSQPATAEVRVGDGVAPLVSVGSPQQGQRIKRVPKGALTLRGRASDATGLRLVEVALRYVSPARGAANRCRWFNGKKLANGSCTRPVWLRSRSLGSTWTYAVRNPRGLPKGFYELRVRGTDTDDNVSSVFSVASKTILIFRVG